MLRRKCRLERDICGHMNDDCANDLTRMPFAKDCILERYSSKIFYRLPQHSSLLLHRGRRLPHLIPEIPPSRGTEGIPHRDFAHIELASRQPDPLMTTGYSLPGRATPLSRKHQR